LLSAPGALAILIGVVSRRGGSFGNRRIDLVGIREIPFPDVADIVFNFPQVKNKNHMTGLK
jgi:hypothetical protein